MSTKLSEAFELLQKHQIEVAKAIYLHMPNEFTRGLLKTEKPTLFQAITSSVNSTNELGTSIIRGVKETWESFRKTDGYTAYIKDVQDRLDPADKDGRLWFEAKIRANQQLLVELLQAPDVNQYGEAAANQIIKEQYNKLLGKTGTRTNRALGMVTGIFIVVTVLAVGATTYAVYHDYANIKLAEHKLLLKKLQEETERFKAVIAFHGNVVADCLKIKGPQALEECMAAANKSTTETLKAIGEVEKELGDVYKKEDGGSWYDGFAKWLWVVPVAGGTAALIWAWRSTRK